jgi:hypothetical protein
VAAKLDQLRREKLEPADRPTGGEDDGERSKEPAHATGIELAEAEALLLESIADDASDQKARDDEEDVDSDEATAHPAGKTVIGDDRQDGDAMQAVDVGRRQARSVILRED